MNSPNAMPDPLGHPRWRGIVPPVITPLVAPDQLDVEGLERLIEHLIRGGVNALFVLGTTGEGPCLSRGARRNMVRETCRIVEARLPILVGVSDPSIADAVLAMGKAADAGADAVVAAPPFYFPLSQHELVDYYLRLAKESPLPVFVYNMPALTKVNLDPQSVAALLQCERIVGLKDSSRDWKYFTSLIPIVRKRRDFSLFVGFEHMLVEAMQAGASGGVCAGANVFPRLFARAFAELLGGGGPTVRRFEESVAIRRELYALGDGATASIQAIKCCLSLASICGDTMTFPFPSIGGARRSRIQEILRSLSARDLDVVSLS